MKVLGFRGVGLLAIIIAAGGSLSCARNHDLEFIQVTPSTETLGIACGTPGVATTCAPTTTYRVIGHYIHPQTTVDITDQVQWTTSNKDLITFADPSQPNVMFPTGLGCGTGLLVEATYNVSSGNQKIASATVDITCGGSGTGTGSLTDFGLTAIPTNQTVSAGGSAPYTIEVTPVNGTPVVNLQVNQSTLPPQISGVNLTPTSVTAGQSAALTLTASPSAAAGTYQVEIQGTDSSGLQNVTVSLIVN